MSENSPKLYCSGGGCTAKLGPGILQHVLERLPRANDPNLLVGFDHADDAAVYQLTDDLALVQTLDFFPPMLEDPYTFGQIAAANALSDVYAMGGEVKLALNIVSFPSDQDLNALGLIMEGGSSKIKEAGAVLAGGHSIAGSDVLYGLSVSGTVNPNKRYQNNTAEVGDVLLLTKPLGVGIICNAVRDGIGTPEALAKAVTSMTTLNKYAAELSRNYDIHACTDVTGFSLLGHLLEMVEVHTAQLFYRDVPYFEETLHYLEQGVRTGAGQRNRSHVGENVRFYGLSLEQEEILFDPQTSGGLLFSLPAADAENFLQELEKYHLPCGVIGKITARTENAIEVYA